MLNLRGISATVASLLAIPLAPAWLFLPEMLKHREICVFTFYKESVEIGSYKEECDRNFLGKQDDSSQLEFAQRIQQEFVAGSAIAPALYRVATKVVEDTEPLLGGDVAYPIHEALNWNLTRFGFQARSSLSAILLINEDGSCWQAKLSDPRQGAKGKIQKYETPVGNGSRAYLPPIPPSIRQLISNRYGVEVPLFGSFWDACQGVNF